MNLKDIARAPILAMNVGAEGLQRENTQLRLELEKLRKGDNKKGNNNS